MNGTLNSALCIRVNATVLVIPTEEVFFSLENVLSSRQRWNVNFIFNAREDEGIWVSQSSWWFCYSEFQLQQCAVWLFTILLKSVLYSCGRFPFSIPGKHIVSFKHGL